MDDTHKKLREWWELCKENTIDFSPSDFDWYEEIENFILKPDEMLEFQRMMRDQIKEDMEEYRKEIRKPIHYDKQGVDEYFERHKKEKFTNCFGLEMERTIKNGVEEKKKSKSGTDSE